MSFNKCQGAQNADFAGAAAGAGQAAGIDAIKVNKIDMDGKGPGKFSSVSSSTFTSSSNKDGKVEGHGETETIVNDNGKITKYKVHS